MKGPIRERFLDARWAFVEKFCAQQGWNHDDLLWEQIQVLRAQPEWKSPPVVADAGTLDCGYSPCCDCCGGIENVGTWATPIGAPEDEQMKLQICADCNEDRDKFRAWLEREMTRAMVLHDDEELLPDGK